MDTKIPSDYFRSTRIALAMAGIEMIQINNIWLRTAYRVYCVILLCVFMYLFNISEVLSLMYVWGDLNKMSFTLSYLITHLVGVLKTTFVMIRMKRIRNYMNTLETGILIPNLDRGGMVEVELVNRAKLYSTIQIVLFLGSAVFIVINRSISALNEKIYETSLDERTNSNITIMFHPVPFSTYLPCNVKKEPCYGIMFFFQSFSYFLQAFYVGGIDNIVYALLLQLRAQLLILKHLISTFKQRAVVINEKENGDKAINGKIPGIYLTRVLRKVTGDLVEHHQLIINLTQSMENEFNILLLIQFTGSLIMFCFTLFQTSITAINSTKFLSIVTYMVLMMYELFMYCYYGNEVTLESDLISRCVFESDWIGTEHKIQTSLLLIMGRAQKPLRLTAGKFSVLSLQTFVTIVRGSVSYYMVLRNTMKKNSA